jgi:septum site-determining protein MinC
MEREDVATDVVFKGLRDGLMVLLPSDVPTDEAIAAMIDKMEENRTFFEGGTCPVYISGEIPQDTLDQLRALLRQEFGLPKVECVGKTTEPTKAVQDAPGRMGGFIEREAYALTIKGTVRNGQRVTYQGDVVIIGDANPGSQLVAGGNVLVFGSLRGTAHAGALGDEGACIVAYQMAPTQVRIAQHIARPPENAKQSSCPEIVTVSDGHIEIAPYLPARKQSGGFR